MTTKQMDAILAKHEATLAATSKRLAMDFDTPARDIVGIACAEIGITEKQWRELQGYRVDRQTA